MNEPLVAYCGPAPEPGALLLAWNFDPPLLAGLLLVALWAARLGRPSAWFAWVLLAVAFVSPLCALSAALFSARALHHVVLIAGVAPLLASALPARRPGPLAGWFALHVLVIWAWHAPAFYSWGVGSGPAYFLMQATMLGSAWGLWRAILAPATEPVAALAALLGTVAQMGLLGALLVFAPVALYGPHFLTTAAWGLSPLEDQQLAGLVMWALSILPYLAVALAMVWRLLAPRDAAA